MDKVTQTSPAFMVLRNDTVLHNYYNNYNQLSLNGVKSEGVPG